MVWLQRHSSQVVLEEDVYYQNHTSSIKLAQGLSLCRTYLVDFLREK